jgi:hypothetical protein
VDWSEKYDLLILLATTKRKAFPQPEGLNVQGNCIEELLELVRATLVSAFSNVELNNSEKALRLPSS